MRNFTTQLIVAVISASSVLAQLPHKCFFVTKMSGSGLNDKGNLISNLPALEKIY